MGKRTYRGSIGFGKDAEGRGKLRGTHHFAFEVREGIVTVRNTTRVVSPVSGSLLAFDIIWNGRTPWVELHDAQGATLRVKVWYWRE